VTTISGRTRLERDVAVALAVAGQRYGQWQDANNAEGWVEMQTWARSLGDERRQGIEGAWNYGRGLV